jgi:transcriptional regulator with XRE-family HTH domain
MNATQIGRLVQAARDRRNMSTTELATLAGVSRQTIENIESARNAPTIDTLRKVLASVGLEMVVVGDGPDVQPGE